MTKERKASYPRCLLLLHKMMYVHPTGVCSEQPAPVRSGTRAVSWHSVAPSSRFCSLTHLLHPQHCALTLFGAPWKHSSTPIYYLVNITLESEKESKNYLKIEVKTKASLDCGLSSTQPLFHAERELSYFPKTRYMLAWQNCII